MLIINSSEPLDLKLVLKKAFEKEIILDFSKSSPYAKLSCIKECKECCDYSYYLTYERSKLPEKIKAKLTKSTDGMYEIVKTDRRCTFYNPEQDFFCSIHRYRPLRCQVYPYFPVIVDERIVITLEPALKMKNSTDKVKQCPGIGIEGKSLKQSISECISFLENLKDTPNLLKTIVLTVEVFNKIRNDR